MVRSWPSLSDSSLSEEVGVGGLSPRGCWNGECFRGRFGPPTDVP